MLISLRLGCFQTNRNIFRVWYNGANNMYYADFIRFIDEKITLIVLSNKLNRNPDKLNFEVAQIIFDKNYKPIIPIADNENNQKISQKIIEIILRDGPEEAVLEYKGRPTRTDVLENSINDEGYHLLSQKNNEAISIFTMKTIAYPKLFNAFDRCEVYI